MAAFCDVNMKIELLTMQIVECSKKSCKVKKSAEQKCSTAVKGTKLIDTRHTKGLGTHICECSLAQGKECKCNEMQLNKTHLVVFKANTQH